MKGDMLAVRGILPNGRCSNDDNWQIKCSGGVKAKGIRVAVMKQ